MDFKNYEPIRDLIERIRKLKRPNSRNKYCQELERRFWHQDWMAQLDIYELWLDIDNEYSRDQLFGPLCWDYWELLQKLVKQGVGKAADLSVRIKEYAIKHIRNHSAAVFITEKAPIEVVRKYKKQLDQSLGSSYQVLAFRLGGDKDFVIDRDRLFWRLDYFQICLKLNLPTTDEEAIDELKLFINSYGTNLECINMDEEGPLGELKFSLLLNSIIDKWRHNIGALGLTRAAEAFDRWDASLQLRINAYYETDSKYRRFPDINQDRLDYYWRYLIEMALADLSYYDSPDDYIRKLGRRNPEMGYFIRNLDMKLITPLEL